MGVAIVARLGAPRSAAHRWAIAHVGHWYLCRRPTVSAATTQPLAFSAMLTVLML